MLSADGWIVSRRKRAMVTRETFTGALKPAEGRISTFPSIRGLRLVSACFVTRRELGATVPMLPKYQGNRRGSYCSVDPSPVRRRGRVCDPLPLSMLRRECSWVRGEATVQRFGPHGRGYVVCDCNAPSLSKFFRALLLLLRDKWVVGVQFYDCVARLGAAGGVC